MAQLVSAEQKKAARERYEQTTIAGCEGPRGCEFIPTLLLRDGSFFEGCPFGAADLLRVYIDVRRGQGIGLQMIGLAEFLVPREALAFRLGDEGEPGYPTFFLVEIKEGGEGSKYTEICIGRVGKK